MRVRRVLALLAALAVGIVVGLLGWNGVRRAEWPPITDPAALRREAGVLCRDGGGWRELQPAQYPPAMTRLHPASIQVSGERVYVGLVPVPGGARFHGYYIWPDTVKRPDGGIEREESEGKSLSPRR